MRCGHCSTVQAEMAAHCPPFRGVQRGRVQTRVQGSNRPSQSPFQDCYGPADIFVGSWWLVRGEVVSGGERCVSVVSGGERWWAVVSGGERVVSPHCCRHEALHGSGHADCRVHRW